MIVGDRLAGFGRIGVISDDRAVIAGLPQAFPAAPTADRGLELLHGPGKGLLGTVSRPI